MNDSLDSSLALPDVGEKPSKQYRSSPYTVREFKALPHCTQRAVDATCEEQEGLSYTTYDDETSLKPYAVGRRTTTPAKNISQPSSPQTAMLLTDVAPLASEATPNTASTEAAPALYYDLLAVVGSYLALTPTVENEYWTHCGPSPYKKGDEHSLALNANTGFFKCYASETKGRAVDFVMFMEECSQQEAFDWLDAHFPIEPTSPEVVQQNTQPHTPEPEVVDENGPLTPAESQEATEQVTDGPCCAYPGLPTLGYRTISTLEPTPTPEGEGGGGAEVPHENGEHEAGADFAELAQATAEAGEADEQAEPTAVDGTVYSTTNYDMFKLAGSNRPVRRPHVATLVREIGKKNMLQLRPIDVTADYIIIDGQHRREAARELGIPLYYRISDLTAADIKNLNVANKNWTGMDYLHHYKELGNPDYQLLAEFMERNPILSFSNAVMLLQDTEQNKAEEFKDGAWTASQSVETAAQTADFIKRIGAEVPSFKQSKNSRFISAVLYSMKTVKGFDAERFLRKILQAPLKLVPCGTRQQYLTLFQLIYNFNTPKDQHIYFL